jgi:ABC-type multidrug transport system permease subunit
VLSGKDWPEATELLATFTRIKNKVQGSARNLFPPRIKVATEVAHPKGGRSSDEPDALGRTLASIFPGIMVMGLLFVGNALMRDLLRERVSGTLKRQLTAPVSAGEILGAKMLVAALVVALGLAILLVAGRLTFGIHWRPIGPMLLASLALVLVVVGLSSTLFSLVRSERQADAVAAILVMVLTFLGGAFLPLNDPPAWLTVVGRASPVYWASQVFRSFCGGMTAEPLERSLAVLAAIGVGLSTIGALTLRVRHLRGAL